MGSASHYWRLVQLDGTGQRRVEEVAIAKTFFYQQFAELTPQSTVPDAPIQRQLFQMLQAEDTATVLTRIGAEYCLRCFISHQIEQVCVQLEMKFGTRHGFTRYELFAFVLDDDQRFMSATPVSTPYRSLFHEILRTFDPDRAGLSTWVMRQVRHHPELRAFLREHGVYLATDWGILNDTHPEQLRRILAEFYTLTPTEIERFYHLLCGYHDVYRFDRLQARQLGKLRGKEVCVPPTPAQLTRIAQYLQDQCALTLSSERILSYLQTLASQLRQYRLHRLGGPLPTESIEQSTAQRIASQMQTSEPDTDLNDENEFLTFYREQIVQCLDQALEQATNERFTYLKRKTAQTAQHFLIALHLFHCQGKSMSEIAPKIGLNAQFQVSRLMKLREFRKNVQAKLVKQLLDCILDKAKTYTEPTRLHTIHHQIEAVLDEQISELLQEAEAEAAVAKQRPLTSLFAQRLCHYLNTRLDTRDDTP